jgi:hypothetical protein
MNSEHSDRRRMWPENPDKILCRVKWGVTALRTVRFHLLEVAYAIAQNPDVKGFLVMPEVELRESRIREEWETAASVLRPEILSRLGIWAGREESWFGIPTTPDDRTQDILAERIKAENMEARMRQVRGDLSFVVLGLLIRQWLLGKGPLTTEALRKMAGCSYPTVANALRLVRHCLVRHSDRKVELDRFPKEEWARMVAVAEKARGTVRFADRSGQPRSAESLLRRLQRLERADIAVGGVVGAKHYHSGLDLVGTPRLDLSLHCWKKEADWSFVERLDPGLARMDRRDEPASLVVHLVRRKESFFEPGADGWLYADQVECLLDLHEARLESQAQELLEALQQRRASHE